MNSLRLALAQINPTVGDFVANERTILARIERAKQVGADLVVFPELAVTGYPPEDLLLRPSFVAANLECVQRLASAARGVTAIVGFVDRREDLYNAAAVLHQGRIAAVYHKMYLPNYAVFDEDRYFGAGERPLLFSLGDSTIGVSICEDIWHPSGPAHAEALAGAHLAVNISASPYHAGKGAARERMLATRAADNVVYVAFCNMVGGQDELVFDGGSVVFDVQGEVVARGRQFAEDFVVADLDLRTVFRRRLHDPRRRKESTQQADTADRVALTAIPMKRRSEPVIPSVAVPLEPVAEVYQALVLGVRDYVVKNGFTDVVIGLSGGIDSALTAAIAADALGPEHVTGLFMPSRYSSVESREDAEQVAAGLGIHCMTVAIDAIFQAYLDVLAAPLAGRPHDVTEENLQARVRGNLLMALSNKLGWLVLTTGNKSEMSVGYSTLYGDMAGGFAVIKDVPKTLVYDLATYVNARHGQPVIPARVFEKAPTAELRPNQRDDDSLPPYRDLDPILHAYVEQDLGFEEITALGFEPAVVADVMCMVDRAEYKRRQAPPGVRITERALGKDRRLPITNRYRREEH